MSSVTTLTSECVNKIHSTPQYWGEEPAQDPEVTSEVPETDDVTVVGRADDMLQEICPGDCSRRGRCVRGTCQCNQGYMGDDCSAKFEHVPQVIKLMKS